MEQLQLQLEGRKPRAEGVQSQAAKTPDPLLNVLVFDSGWCVSCQKWGVLFGEISHNQWEQQQTNENGGRMRLMNLLSVALTQLHTLLPPRFLPQVIPIHEFAADVCVPLATWISANSTE